MSIFASIEFLSSSFIYVICFIFTIIILLAAREVESLLLKKKKLLPFANFYRIAMKRLFLKVANIAILLISTTISFARDAMSYYSWITICCCYDHLNFAMVFNPLFGLLNTI